MSARFWTVPQALVWIVGSNSMLGPKTTVEKLISRCTSKAEEPETGLGETYLFLLYSSAQAREAAKLAARDVPEAAITIKSAEDFNEALGFRWNIAIEELTRATRDGKLPLRGRAARGERIAIIDEAALGNIVFREDGAKVFACYPDDNSISWTTLRLDSEQVRRLWPLKAEVTRPQNGAPISNDRALSSLTKIASKSKTKKGLLQELRKTFPDRHISEGQFERLYAQLPAHQRRARGETNKALQRAR